MEFSLTMIFSHLYHEPIEVEDENSLDVGISEHLEPIEVAGENLVEHRSIGQKYRTCGIKCDV